MHGEPAGMFRRWWGLRHDRYGGEVARADSLVRWLWALLVVVGLAVVLVVFALLDDIGFELFEPADSALRQPWVGLSSALLLGLLTLVASRVRLWAGPLANLVLTLLVGVTALGAAVLGPGSLAAAIDAQAQVGQSEEPDEPADAEPDADAAATAEDADDDGEGGEEEGGGNSATPSPSVLTRVATLAVVAFVVGKHALLVRYSARFRNARVDASQADLPLFDFQDGDIRRISDEVRKARLNETNGIVQVRGHWGDGKSFLIRQLESKLLDPPPPPKQPSRGERFRRAVALRNRGRDEERPILHAVHLFDVWTAEAEPDLHRAIVETVLAHPASFGGLAWLRYPFRLLLPDVASSGLAVKVGAGAAPGSVGVDVPFALPRLTFQPALERAVSRARRDRVVTVLVLDEVDRASSPVAQAAVTLTKRSLELPGLVVVMPYVQPAIYFKAFNPLVPQGPDLESVALQTVHNWTMRHRVALGGSIRDLDEYKILDARIGGGKGGAAASGDGSQVVEPGGQTQPRLSQVLRRVAAGLDDRTTAQLQNSMAEKYLSSSNVAITPLNEQRAVEVAMTLETIRAGREFVLGHPTPKPPTAGVDVDKRIRQLADARQNFVGAGAEPTYPPLRAYLGALVTVFNDEDWLRDYLADAAVPNRTIGRTGDRDDRFFALVEAAYVSSALRY